MLSPYGVYYFCRPWFYGVTRSGFNLKEDDLIFSPEDTNSRFSFSDKFILSYMPRTTPTHEYITVSSNWFRYRAQVFLTINQLFNLFKKHFQDPLPRKCYYDVFFKVARWAARRHHQTQNKQKSSLSSLPLFILPDDKDSCLHSSCVHIRYTLWYGSDAIRFHMLWYIFLLQWRGEYSRPGPTPSLLESASQNISPPSPDGQSVSYISTNFLNLEHMLGRTPARTSCNSNSGARMSVNALQNVVQSIQTQQVWNFSVSSLNDFNTSFSFYLLECPIRHSFAKNSAL